MKQRIIVSGPRNRVSVCSPHQLQVAPPRPIGLRVLGESGSVCEWGGGRVRGKEGRTGVTHAPRAAIGRAIAVVVGNKPKKNKKTHTSKFPRLTLFFSIPRKGQNLLQFSGMGFNPLWFTAT